MRVSDIFFAAVRLAEEVRQCVRQISAELRDRVLALKSRLMRPSARCGWLRGLRRQSADCRYLMAFRRRLVFEGLEYRAMLDTLTFLPNVSTTWNSDPHNDNWYDQDTYQFSAWQPGDTAVFDGLGKATVDVSNNFGAVSVAGIQFEEGSWSINGGGTISIYQPSPPTPSALAVTVDTNEPVAKYTVVNDTIAAQITGSSNTGLEITGPGTVALGMYSLYPNLPSITLDGGGLQFTPGSLYSTPIYVNPGSGNTAALAFNNSPYPVENPIDLQSGTLRIDTEGNDVTISEKIYGAGNLVASDTNGNGQLTLSLNNGAFTGPTTIVSGTLVLENGSSALGTGTLTVDGGVLSMGGGTYSQPAPEEIKVPPTKFRQDRRLAKRKCA